MYSNRVNNAISPSWLASNINANAKKHFQTKFNSPKSFAATAGGYHFKDVEEFNLGGKRNNLSVIGGRGRSRNKIKPTDDDDEIDENDPLTQKIREVIMEELNKPQSKLATLNLGITGLNYVFDSKQHIGCKFFWATIIIACISVCSYQMVDRIGLFLRYPVAAEIGVVQNQTVKFPTLVICPLETDRLMDVWAEYYKKNPDKEKNKDCDRRQIAELIGLEYNGKKLTADEVWDLTQPNGTDYEGKRYFQKSQFQDLLIKVDDAFLSEEIVTVFMGKCSKFQMNKDVEFHGIATQISFVSRVVKNKCNRYGYKILTMDTYDPIDMKSFVPVTAGAKVGFTVLVKQYEALDVPNHACVSSENFLDCHTRCARDMLDQKIKCSLPYMVKSSRPMCTNGKDAVDTQEIAEQVLLDLNVTKDCGCTRKCIRIMYSMLPKSYKFNADDTDVSVYYASNYFEIVKESYAYDWMSLLCDIGGNLGLYLGLSVLSIFEIIQSFFETYGKQENKAGAVTEVKPADPEVSRGTSQGSKAVASNLGHYGNMAGFSNANNYASTSYGMGGYGNPGFSPTNEMGMHRQNVW